MRVRDLTAVAAVVVLAACFHPSYSNPTCVPSGECPEGLTCIEGVCQQHAELDGALDANACADPAARCVDAETLRTCESAAAQPVDTACAWGCLDGPTAHCGQLVPHAGAVAPTDLELAAGLADIDLDGTLSDTGQITGGGIARPIGSGVQNGIGFRVAASGVAIYTFSNLHVIGHVRFTGARPVALVSVGGMVIDDHIDGPSTCNSVDGGLGGHRGGSQSSSGDGNGGGAAGIGTHDAADGGAGGGRGARGGDGGRNLQSFSTPAGGVSFGTPEIDLLEGGGGGGGGGGSVSFGGGGRGGDGGGALQLVANGAVSLGVSGKIDANGCDGGDGNNGPIGNGDGAGGGGGAGGVILIEALRITIEGTVTVSGGEGGAGYPSGGTGGHGGASTQLAGLAGGDQAQHGGGGGGGVGRIRFNTRTATGTTFAASAVVSPTLDATDTTATTGLAVVE